MRALITGGGGQLASELERLLGSDARSFSHSDLDIADSAALDQAFDEVKPDVVFNCAAFHNVDHCESEPDQAWATNVRAVRDLASRGAKLVHLSTNYVFDGRGADPYTESDLPSPQSLYALTKLAGEHAAQAYGDGCLIVRTAGLYGLRGSRAKGGNFVNRMIARARDQGRLRVVSDQLLQPTFTRDLAYSLVAAVDAGASGTLHLTAAGRTSWYEFTVAIMELAGVEVPIEPIGTVTPPGSPKRPLNGLLASIRADQLGIPALRGWHESLADYMTQSGLRPGLARTA